MTSKGIKSHTTGTDAYTKQTQARKPQKGAQKQNFNKQSMSGKSRSDFIISRMRRRITYFWQIHI